MIGPHPPSKHLRWRAVLLLSLLVLAISAGWVVMDRLPLGERADAGRRAAHAPPAVNFDAWALRFQTAEEIAGKAGRGRRLFAPGVSLYWKDRAKLEPVTPDTLIGGIPCRWLQAQGLAISDANVEAADPDHDGFSNAQEYGDGTNSTNPLDPASHPSLATRLRVRAVHPAGLQVQWRARMQLSGQDVFQINWTDAQGSHSKIVPLGQEIAQLRITGLSQREGRQVLELTDTLTGAVVTAPMGEAVQVDRSQVELVLLFPQYSTWSQQAVVGETIALPGEGEPKFRLAELSSNGVRLVALPSPSKESQVEFFAPLLSEEESHAFAAMAQP